MFSLNDEVERFRLIFIGDFMTSWEVKQVGRAWFMGRSRRFTIYPSMDGVKTDGLKIWYGDLLIGWTRASGHKALLDYTARSNKFVNLRVSRAVCGLERLSERHCSSMLMFRPEGEINPRSGLPRRRIPLIGPTTTMVYLRNGRRMLRNERSGDTLRW